MRAVTSLRKRALSMFEIVIVLSMSAAALTAAFALVAGIASGDQTLADTSAQVEERLETELERDLTSSVPCPMTGEVVSTNTAKAWLLSPF